MIEQVKIKHLQCAFLKLTEANMFYILGLVEGLKCAQGEREGKSLAKKEITNYIEHGINSTC